MTTAVLVKCDEVEGGAAIFTPAEANVVLAIYVLVLGITLYRKSASVKQKYRTTIEAGYTSGMTLFLTAASVAVAFMLASDLIPALIAQSVAQLTRDKHVAPLLLNLFFIGTGILLEPPAVIVAFLPTVMPLLRAVGVDPVVWGVIFMINAGIGMIHPPVGLTPYSRKPCPLGRGEWNPLRGIIKGAGGPLYPTPWWPCDCMTESPGDLAHE